VTQVKTLILDIETAPNTAHVWGIWQQNVGLPQLLESGYVLCVAAKWVGEDKIRFHRGPTMIKAVYRLIDQADVVVGYNHIAFDMKWLNTEFARAGLTPPSPYVNVDLLRVVRDRFRFPSNKLDYVAGELLGANKAPTGGHATWIGAMAGDKTAWARMEAYNKADVALTERLYHYLKPWIRNIPNAALYCDAQPGEITCPQCGSNKMHARGIQYTQLSSYQRYQCYECKRWARGKHRINAVNAR